MIVGTRGSILNLLLWQWKNSTLFVLAAVLAAAAHQVFEASWMTMPTLPLAVGGGALGIFVSFRTNAAYGRWWEGRQLWGRLVNTSRHLASQASAYLGHQDVDAVRRLVLRQIAYVHMLRVVLRQQDVEADAELGRLLTEAERARLAGRSSPTHTLLQEAAVDTAQLCRDGKLTDFQLSDLDATLRVLLDVQGGCERIKKTPMPRAYGFVASRMVVYYGILFPFGVAEHLGWFTVPISLMVCIAFTLISEAGRVLEDPFNMFYNGLPLSSLSNTIERNLREAIGDDELPPTVVADNGILM